MRQFARLKPLIGGAPAELPPPEIYGELIDDLHAALFTFVVGATTTLLVGAIASWRTGNPWLAALTVCAVLVAVARIVIIAEYRKQRPRFGNDVDVLRRFERLHAVGATVYGALIGFTIFVAYLFTDDPVSFLLITAMRRATPPVRPPAVRAGRRLRSLNSSQCCCRLLSPQRSASSSLTRYCR
jgi:hypothetical protein